MPHLRQLTFGFVCGILAFTGYWLESTASVPLPVSVSHFFIFLAAIAAGPEAALLAFSLGSLPTTLLENTSLHLPIQAAVVTIVLCVHWRFFKEIPAYLTAVIAWLLILIPLRIVLPEAAWHSGTPIYYFGLQSLIDLFLIASGSALLFIPKVWELVYFKPYQPNRTKLFSAVSGTTLSLVALLALFITPSISSAVSFSPLMNFVLVIVLTVFVAGISAFGTRWFELTMDELSHHETRSRLSGTFTPDGELVSTRPEGTLTSNPKVPESDVTHPVIQTPGVCALTSDFGVVFMNDRFRDLLQVNAKPSRGQDLFELSMNDQIRKGLEDVLRNLNGNENHAGEIRINELPDTLRFHSITVDPHQLDENETGWLCTIQEITDRRTIESRLFELQKMKNLGSVMGSIAHAFNNSLTTISGQASFALRCDTADAKVHALEEIRIHAQKAGKLVWKLLDFSEGKPSEFAPFSIASLLKEKEDLLKKLVGESFNVQLNFSDQPFWIKGDRHLIMQVLTELTTNAREAYRGGTGEISIELNTEEMDEDIVNFHPGVKAGQYARITVKDDGCGMTNEMVSEAFAPLHSDRDPATAAHLGLSIVYAIVRAHDGFINVESFPDKGTTVSVYLPLNEEANNSESVAAEANAENLNGANHVDPNTEILVVEDEPEVRDLIGRMLEMLGYKVSTCSNAFEANEKIQEREFDLLLVDYMMPKKSGLDLISELKSEAQSENSKCNARYLLMTGCGVNTKKNDDKIPVLSKPFDMDALGKSIEEALQ